MGALISIQAYPLCSQLQMQELWPRDGALGDKEASDTVYTCKAWSPSLSEISVAKDLIPMVLKVAWMILFRSL